MAQAPNCAIAPVLTVIDGKATTLSTDVARHFGKRHDDVLRAISNLCAQLDKERLRNFAETVETRPNPSGGAPIESRAYRLTRDGFTLLAMGFTGKRALQFKLAYIDAFNQMEAALLTKAQPVPMVPHTDAPLPRLDPASWEHRSAGLTIEAAKNVVAALDQWALRLPACGARNDVRDALEHLRRLLVRGWTEVDESLTCLSTALRYLNRWQGHSGRFSSSR